MLMIADKKERGVKIPSNMDDKICEHSLKLPPISELSAYQNGLTLLDITVSWNMGELK